MKQLVFSLLVNSIKLLVVFLRLKDLSVFFSTTGLSICSIVQSPAVPCGWAVLQPRMLWPAYRAPAELEESDLRMYRRLINTDLISIIMKSICPFFNLQLSYYDFRSTCFMKTQSESCFFLYSDALGTEQVVILSAWLTYVTFWIMEPWYRAATGGWCCTAADDPRGPRWGRTPPQGDRRRCQRSPTWSPPQTGGPATRARRPPERGHTSRLLRNLKSKVQRYDRTKH